MRAALALMVAFDMSTNAASTPSSAAFLQPASAEPLVRAIGTAGPDEGEAPGAWAGPPHTPLGPLFPNTRNSGRRLRSPKKR